MITINEEKRYFSTYFVPGTPESSLHVLTNVALKQPHDIHTIIFISILKLNKQAQVD